MPPTTPNGTTLVPNPMHQVLSTLYAQLQRDADTMKNALKPANQQMSAQGTWLGPAAVAWGSQLNGYASDCATQVNAMLSEVESALSAEPAQVTAQEAQQKAKMLSMLESGRLS
jgi:hypothetical protein